MPKYLITFYRALSYVQGVRAFSPSLRLVSGKQRDTSLEDGCLNWGALASSHNVGLKVLVLSPKTSDPVDVADPLTHDVDPAGRTEISLQTCTVTGAWLETGAGRQRQRGLVLRPSTLRRLQPNSRTRTTYDRFVVLGQ